MNRSEISAYLFGQRRSTRYQSNYTKLKLYQMMALSTSLAHSFNSTSQMSRWKTPTLTWSRHLPTKKSLSKGRSRTSSWGVETMRSASHSTVKQHNWSIASNDQTQFRLTLHKTLWKMKWEFQHKKSTGMMSFSARKTKVYSTTFLSTGATRTKLSGVIFGRNQTWDT